MTFQARAGRRFLPFPANGLPVPIFFSAWWRQKPGAPLFSAGLSNSSHPPGGGGRRQGKPNINRRIHAGQFWRLKRWKSS